jgi:hypothetical protein
MASFTNVIVIVFKNSFKVINDNVLYIYSLFLILHILKI